jgi:hypothetical protein
MRGSVVVVATLWACSSPDVCDQHVVADIVAMSMQHDDAPASGSDYTCTGGGSLHAAYTGFGPNSIWSGTVTFAGCTEAVGSDSLTLTGTVQLGGDTVNLGDNDHGSADMLAIKGSIAACGKVDETCPIYWGPQQDESDAAFHTVGAVCGRQFP